jgi:SPP1 family phage portal protein
MYDEILYNKRKGGDYHMFLNSYQTKAMNDMKSKITRLSNPGKPQEEFLYSNINEFQDSEKRKTMLKAQEYYTNDNDIKDRKRYYIDRKGVQQEVKNLSNSKLAHPFMRKLTNQKVNYLLSKELSIQCDDVKFSEALTDYVNKKFLKMLKNVGRDAIVNGIAWVQAYYNKQGQLSFKRIPSEEIIPFWADADHTILEAVLRYYSITRYLPDGVKKEIVKVEYHTTEGVWYYIKGDRGLEPDPDRGDGIRGHFIISEETKDDKGNIQVDKDGNPVMQDVQATWDKVPFIAFKYNADEISLLKWVKSLIDDYDINTSDTSNNLQDVPNSIKVVKNYDGTDKGEFVQNLATFRTAFVSGDGDMTAVETKMDIAAIDSHLNRLRKDIYEAGSGVDTQEVSLGNASGVALKFRYADLDSDTDDMASEFAAAFEELIWFVKVDILNKGLGDFIETNFEIIFNTDSIINEHEIIEDTKNSVGIISDETIIANHPWVTDTQAELDRFAKEKEAKMAEMQELMKQQNEGFGEEDNPDDEGAGQGGEE